jgi:Mrp family chromosome partitioning ATPase
MNREPGRIITFYSYKGGTGRSMILANVACVLASNGLRVLVVDWDVEAPGLHRYFTPFLVDPDLDASPGVIDLVTRFAVEATTPPAESPQDTRWLDEIANIDLYATSLQLKIPGWKDLDFMPAGQLDSTYAERVTSFDWRNFYERLRGGALIDRLREHMREEYDFVLIDSRTGVTDTAGICTVHLPDDLVCCFTLNKQGLEGAAGVAKSVRQHRAKDDGMRILPVPSRVELNEKLRLDGARTRARRAFRDHIGWLSRQDMSEADYWGAVEVPYWPFYAFEETLAAFVDPPGHPTSILAAAERIAGILSKRKTMRLGPIDGRRREEIVAAFERAAAPVEGRRVFVSFGRDDREFGRRLIDRLRSEGVPAVGPEIEMGERVDASEVGEAKHLVAIVGRSPSQWQMREMSMFLSSSLADPSADRRIVPVLAGEDLDDSAPAFLRQLRSLHGRDDATIQNILRAVTSPSFLDAEPVQTDPQKGKWGGLSESNGRRLTAVVSPRPGGEGWFHLEMRVESTDPSKPLAGRVRFHLHDTFPTASPEVPVTDETAWLKVAAWGAFTVGAEADGGETKLELDLAELPDAPDVFKSR